MGAIQDAEQIVAEYLAELLTPIPMPVLVPTPAVQVVAVESWRHAVAGKPVRSEENRYLLCIAAGVKLAVPVTDVTHMLPMPPLAPPNTNHPACLGRWRHPSGEARVADLAAILSPDMAGTPASTLVLLRMRDWALACTVVDEPVELLPDAIQWRPNASTRPWLAGMATDPKCGVVGTPALIEWLEQELGP